MTLPMSWSEWAGQDGVGLAGLVRAGQITPRDLAAQAAAAIEKVNPQLTGVIEVFTDAIEDPAGNGTHLDGPFAGLPFLMKDLGPTMKGRLQEQGSRFMAGNRPTADTFLTAQMRKAGLNLIGRTTTPEFGVCSSADNPAVYVTRNPWNTDYSTCGSSAGSGAMVAAGAVPIAHSTDGGGSIRIPAAACGNIGLKPSRGVFSVAPHLSDLSTLVSAQGCQSRSVRDTAAFVDACRGAAPGEFMPFWQPAETCTAMLARDPKPLRIALSHTWGDYAASDHARDELARAGQLLESLGHHVDWAVPAIDFPAAFAAQTTCYISNFAFVITNLLASRKLERPPADLIEPINIKIWEMGRDISFIERARMQTVFNATSRALGDFFTHWDVVLTPTMAGETPRVGTREYLTISDNPSVLDWFGNLWRNFAFTPLANLCGVPAVSMPMGRHANGLPLGIQAMGPQGADGLLLQLAAQIERAVGGWNGGAKPGVHVAG